MRSYLYVKGSISNLAGVKGCRVVPDAKRGNGIELWSDDAVMPRDYPAKVALVTQIGDAFQVATIVDDGGALLAKLKDAGMQVYASAKEFAAAQPALADALYPRREKLDAQGKPTGASEKVPGGVLQVAMCFQGDDAQLAADPEAAAETERANEIVEEWIR